MDEALLLSHWSLEPGRHRPDIDIEGSPERCAFRTVTEDGAGNTWVLERIFPRTRKAKLRIAATLEHLDRNGMPGLLPYRRTAEGAFLAETAEGPWMLRPYLAGVELPRPDYLDQAWRGEALARFLIRLRERSAGLPDFEDEEPFALEPYIRQLLAVIGKRRPGVRAAVQPVLEHLEGAWFPLCPDLPHGFCHGDFHPVNVIWGPQRIGAVIDWEFTGPKPELFDVANLLGCAGFENPAGLTGPLAAAVVRTLHEARFAAEESWQTFTGLLLALRFGWLSEWLRKRDEEMLELELVYTGLILEHRDPLNRFFTGRSDRS